MAKTQASKTTATHDRRLRALESELEKVTERFRVAKLKAREAKAEAKAVKKEMKHARSALLAAQEEHEATSRRAKEKSSVASSGRAGAKANTVTDAAPKRRIADSPERVRQPPRKRRRASVAVSTPAPPPPAPSELLEPDAAREPHPDEADSEQER